MLIQPALKNIELIVCLFKLHLRNFVNKTKARSNMYYFVEVIYPTLDLLGVNIVEN